MKAVIPVAGHGTRLEPHTLKLQKCLLPVAGKPVLEHILDRITRAGVTDITLIIGHLGSQVRDFCQTYSKAEFTFVKQKEQLGLGHAVYKGLDHSDEPVVLVLGDAILELDYQNFLASFHTTIGVAHVPDPQRFGIVELDGERIVKVWEKPEIPPGDLAIIGIYYISSQKVLAQAVEYLIENDLRTRNEYQLTDAFEEMLKNGHNFQAFNVEECLDCGIPDTLLSTNRKLLEQNGKSSIHSSANIVNSNLSNCTISENCRVENAGLENVIMLPGSRVAHKCLGNTILGFDEHIIGEPEIVQ